MLLLISYFVISAAFSRDGHLPSLEEAQMAITNNPLSGTGVVLRHRDVVVVVAASRDSTYTTGMSSDDDDDDDDDDGDGDDHDHDHDGGGGRRESRSGDYDGSGNRMVHVAESAETVSEFAPRLIRTAPGFLGVVLGSPADVAYAWRLLTGEATEYAAKGQVIRADCL